MLPLQPKSTETNRQVIPTVDLVVLTRHAGPLPSEVETGIRGQQGIEIVLHRVVGVERPGDHCRWDAIARARNEGKSLGSSSWLMFLDDDVVLEPSCVSTLVGELSRRPAYGALAADYLGQSRQGEIARHVSMGATLFRREAIQPIHFTWRDKQCECQCCCDDLRRLHWGIDYHQQARARHLAEASPHHCAEVDGACSRGSARSVTGHVLAAFDRRHLRLFQERFLRSLRGAGNKEVVIALAVGLYPSERERLSRLSGVRPWFRNDNGQTVARRRLRDFEEIANALPPDAAIAYWDAGDVVFQGRLHALWHQVLAHPDKLLVAREPSGHPENQAVVHWTRGIVDAEARRNARHFLYYRAWLNGGFVAGTARVMSKYFRTVQNWYDVPTLKGSADWGDQLALNLYCHSDPERWHEVSEGWNYCLCLRNPKTVYRRENGRYIDVRGVPVHVVHGNAHSLSVAPFRRQPL